MAPDLILLQEYQSKEVPLTDEELVHLLPMTKGADSDERRVFESISSTRHPGVHVLKPGPFVGRLGLPSGRSIDIRSRFTFPAVLELIRLSTQNPTRKDRLLTPSAPNPFLVDVIAAAFAREVDRLVSSGLAKGYSTERFHRPPYPGTPDVTMHLSRFGGRPDKLVTHARQMTRDVPVNQALGRALDVLLRLSLPGDLSRTLRMTSAAFSRVSRPPVTASAVGRMTLDRLTSRYETALALAELVLSGRTLGPTGTSDAGASIVFDMTKVWEKYVEHWVRSSFDPGHHVTGQYGFNITRDGSVTALADVLVTKDGEPVALYDAKYKGLTGTPKTGDIYQMVTYCLRLGLDEATLVYPAPAPSASYVVEGVTVRTLGLELEPADLAMVS